ncbi:MAG: flagellar hook-associated protein 3 [Leptospiraceae bacterium]|nr:flagellar hook-associated protein 3 [Leptospiraceae bacterium]MDW8307346.1 flagellar hook-associated protein 3 [Leptospiraceae bacterium]
MRVTNLMINNNLVHTLNRHQYQLQTTEEMLATGSKIRLPSDDPVGAANQMLLRSRMHELEQYERNIQEAKDRLNLMDGQLDRVGEIFQRMRYLTVQAANGTNSGFELREAIAKEINQHLLALVDIANTKDATGRPLFGGSVIERDPFLPIFTHLMSQGIDQGNAMTAVQYQGDNQVLVREIERNEEMAISIPGHRIFWGTNMSIASNKDSFNYVALGDQSFAIDGVRIDVSAGDTLNDIIDKINTAPLEVRAAKGAQNEIILTTKTPHMIWLEDLHGGTVLQDLGLIDGANPEPPNNYSPNATISGLSLFDVVIMLRDDLIKADSRLVGGRDLEALDMALENILRYRSEIGARLNRLEQHEKRIAWDKTYAQELLAKNESVDVVESIVNLKWLESVHAYALRVGAGIIKPTLMDFLR